MNIRHWVAALSALCMLAATGTPSAQPAPAPPPPAAPAPPVVPAPPPFDAAADAAAKAASPWWAHVKILAADDMQGRQTGSPGYQRAADYVAQRFKAYGLQPAGTEGYFQPVDFEAQVIDQDASAGALILPDGTRISEPGLLVLTANTWQPPKVKAALVFIGYGVHMPEAGYDDFAGLDLKGKVAVLMRGGPASLSPALRAHAAAEELATALEAAGAVGLITLSAPPQGEGPWARLRAQARLPGMYLADPALRRYRKPFFHAQLNPAMAAHLFVDAEKGYGELVDLAGSGAPLPRFALKTSLEATVVATTSPVRSSNVVGVLPGSDPALAPEAVVLSAHLDHLGTAAPEPGRDGIFNGAMDNAAGVATLLETAKAIQKARARPKRSILFLALTAEEKGLQGSRYFARHPSRFAGKLVADINVDMFLPLAPLSRLIAYGDTESTLGGHARAVAAGQGIEIVPDPEPGRFIFIRSDQYNFIRNGIPAVMLDFTPNGPEEERTFADWRVSRYHDQGDDLAQPVDVAAAGAYNAFLMQLLLRVADAPERPAWLEGSFFKRFEKAGAP